MRILTPANFFRLGNGVLTAGLVGGLLLVLVLVWKAPALLPVLPVLLAGGAVFCWLLRHPLLHLTVLLAGSVLLSSLDPGFQVSEIFYGLYFLGYLALWYSSRLFFYEQPVCRDATDYAAAIFLLWMTFGVALNFFFGGILSGAISEWSALAIFGFYFPIKEACAKYKYGPHAICGVLIWLGLFFLAHHIMEYREGLTSATHAYEILSGRSRGFEFPLLVASYIALIPLLHADSWKQVLLFSTAFFLCLGGLIMTQSRGYWIDFIFGFVFLIFILEKERRNKLLLFGTYGVAIAICLAFVISSDLIELVVIGLADRFASIGTAFTQDLSLVNRFYESGDAWDRIKMNPILGYGLGVPYTTYDIIVDAHKTKRLVHNGFLSLWYRLGIIGLTTMVFVWWSNAWKAISIFRKKKLSFRLNLLALMAGVSLVAVVPSANTSNPFQLAHSVMMITLLTGWAAGLHLRTKIKPA